MVTASLLYAVSAYKGFRGLLYWRIAGGTCTVCRARENLAGE